jgi:hypothetical protein
MDYKIEFIDNKIKSKNDKLIDKFIEKYGDYKSDLIELNTKNDKLINKFIKKYGNI